MKIIRILTDTDSELRSPWALTTGENITLFAEVLDSVTGLVDPAGVTWAIASAFKNAGSMNGVLVSGTWSDQILPSASPCL